MLSWNRQFGYHARWLWGVIASLLVLCVGWPTHGHAAAASLTQRTRQVASKEWARVTVVQGRLSVDLRDADIQTVLAQIAEQAGFTLLTGPLERQTVSVQFADVPLEQGVRRLLRLASLNHVMLTAPAAAGRVALKELRVFAGGDARGPFVIAARPTEVVAVQARQPEETPATPQEEPRATQNPFQELILGLQKQQQAQPQAEAAGAAPAPNPFLEALGRAQEQQQAQPPFSGPEQREETPHRGLGQKP
jgi:hypothetical protein